MAKAELENKVEYLEKELNDMRDAFRRLAQQNSDYLGMLGKLKEELSDFRLEVARAEQNRSVKQLKEFGSVR